MAKAPAKPKHTFPPYDDLVEEIRREGIGAWSSIEDAFIAATSSFDREFAQTSNTGWYQAKARYFNDIVVLLIANASGKDISVRSKKKSQLFDKIDIDLCYPSEGVPIISGETKALGTPPHPGNQNKARGCSSDLHKRAREVAFTATDLKVAYAPPKPIGSFQKWIDSTEPGYFAFWLMRAADDSDFGRARSILGSLRSYCNGVGAMFYEPIEGTEAAYAIKNVNELSMDRCIREIAQRLA